MDNQLPAEVLTEIETLSRSLSEKRYAGQATNFEYLEYEEGVKDGATEYANKLHQVEQCNTELRVANAKMRNLLEKVISRHEAGLLPDRFIYNEIKTFLDEK